MCGMVPVIPLYRNEIQTGYQNKNGCELGDKICK